MGLEGFAALLSGGVGGYTQEEDRQRQLAIELANAEIARQKHESDLQTASLGRSAVQQEIDITGRSEERKRDVVEPREDFQYEQTEAMKRATLLKGTSDDIRTQIANGTVRDTPETRNMANQAYNGYRKMVEGSLGIKLPDSPDVVYVPDSTDVKNMQEFYMRSAIDTTDEQVVQAHAKMWNCSPDLIRLIGNPDLTRKEKVDAQIEQDKLKIETMDNAWSSVENMMKDVSFKNQEYETQQEMLVGAMVAKGLTPEAAKVLAGTIPHLRDFPDANTKARIMADWNEQTRQLQANMAIAELQSATQIQTTGMTQQGAWDRTVLTTDTQKEIAAAKMQMSQQGTVSAATRNSLHNQLIKNTGLFKGTTKDPSIDIGDPTVRQAVIQQQADIITNLYPDLADRDSVLNILSMSPEASPKAWPGVEKELRRVGADPSQIQEVWRVFGYEANGVPRPGASSRAGSYRAP